MKGFKTIIPNYLNSANESISPQYGDPSVKKLLDILYKMKETIIKYDIESRDLVNVMKKSITSNFNILVKDFEDVVEERFGFRVKIQIVTSRTLSFSNFSLPLPKSNDNVFYNELINKAIEFYDKNKSNTEVINKLKRDHETYKDTVGVIKTTSLDANAHVLNMVKTRDALNFKGVTINDDKVYINGLPKDFYCIINMYFFQMTDSELEFSPEEILAVFLHELGHAYTYISYTYRCVHTSITFDDAVRDYLRKQNGTPNDMITYIYSSVTKGKKPKSKNTIFMFNDLMNVVANPISPDGDDLADLSAEIVADQFVNRFGYGLYNAEALRKIVKVYGPYENGYVTMQIFAMRKSYENSILHFLSLTIEEISGKNIFLRMMYYIMVSFVFLKALAKDLYSGMIGNNKEYSHEPPEKRINRIKNDYIRQLRIYKNDLSKEEVNFILEQINDLNNILKDINKITSLPFGEKLKNYVMSLYSGEEKRINKSLYEMEGILENITENSLYVYKEKIRNLL